MVRSGLFFILAVILPLLLAARVGGEEKRSAPLPGISAPSEPLFGTVEQTDSPPVLRGEAGVDKAAGTQQGTVDTIESNGQVIRAGASAFSLGATESMLGWDAWHRRVGKTLGKRANRLARAARGLVLVKISISRAGKVEAELLQQSGDPYLAQSTLKAARSLDSDPVVEFPPQSKRTGLIFNFEYRRGAVIPSHKFIKGDWEKVGNDDTSPNEK